MSQLPIERVIPSLIDKLQSHNQFILKASTGAGKSTHLPLVLLKEKLITGKIIMLEPRRLAAKNIAGYLAKQLGEAVGEQVGFRIKGETRVSASTQLEIVTEGIMTRMIQSDPELTGVGLLIFDEYHERSLHADTALAFALEVQEALREDLKLLIMSATLDNESLQTLLPNAAYLESDGRMYPVETRYHPLKANQRILEAVELAIRRVLESEKGSILVFLSGVGDIKNIAERLSNLPSSVLVAPLYGQLESKLQQQALIPAPKGQRKVVLATNIAETSLTIEGVRIVIDSGYEQRATFDSKTGVTKLEKKRIAQSSAEQRKGRAGRIEEGICVRLYSESQYQQQALMPLPEIESSDLTPLILELLKWGVNDPKDLMWLTSPPSGAVKQARRLLTALMFIDEHKQLTPLGEQAQRLGLDPRLAAVLLQAEKQSSNHLQTALHVIPLIEEPAKRVTSKDLTFHLSLFLEGKYPNNSVYQQRVRHFSQLFSMKPDRQLASTDLIGEILIAGFSDRIAMAKGEYGCFQLANGHGVQVDELEAMAESEFLVVVDLLKGMTNRSHVFLAAPLLKHALLESASERISVHEFVDWDEKNARMIAEERTQLGVLVLNKIKIENPDESKCSQALLTMIGRKGLSCLAWDAKAHTLFLRLLCCEKWLPELSLPKVNEPYLLQRLDEWLLPFMNGVKNVKQLKAISVAEVLEAYIGWSNMALVNEYLPTHYQLPTGTKAVINYDPQFEPKISVRMQEVYGEADTPLLANGKKKLVMELLSPAQRPLQTTSDLAGFWKGSYKDVQKEMKGRYPKHIWPDDPAMHQATKKTKRHFN